MENLTLYEINNAAKELQLLLLQEEMTPEEYEKAMAEIKRIFIEKNENIIKLIRNMETAAEGMKEEQERLYNSRKNLEEGIKKLKEMTQSILEQNNMTKLITPAGTMSIAKNPMSVEIIDESLVPEEYKKTKIVVEVDKAKLKEHYKSTGEIIEGVRFIDDKKTLRIK